MNFLEKACHEGVAWALNKLTKKLGLGATEVQSPVSEVLLNLLRVKKDPVIVQLGAHVGNVEGDPLYPLLSQGENRSCDYIEKSSPTVILVEPVREHFDKLKEAYSDIPGIVFENVAIADHEGMADFYRLGVNPEDYGFPSWLTELGSLKQSRIREMWDNYERDEATRSFLVEHQIKESVQCTTFQSLIAKHNLSSVDFLQMDVEGFEYEILSSIDFSQTEVRFINYERVLLQGKQQVCEDCMRGWGYRLRDYDKDTFAYRKQDQRFLNNLVSQR